MPKILHAAIAEPRAVEEAVSTLFSFDSYSTYHKAQKKVNELATLHFSLDRASRGGRMGVEKTGKELSCIYTERTAESMEELKEKLRYVRSLLTAMVNLNREEVQARGQMGQPVEAEYVPLEKSTKKGGRMAALAAVFVGLSLLFALMAASGKQRSIRQRYEEAVTQSEFNWAMNHLETKEPYPGYTGKVQPPVSFGGAYVRALPRAGFSALVLTVIAGAVVFSAQRSRNTTIDRENARRAEEYQKALGWSEYITRVNGEAQRQIAGIENRRQMISREYITSICPWFPKEYCYFEAVDFFLHELELGTATTLPEAIKNYREELFRRGVTERLDSLGRKMEVMIDNQRVMIDKQDEIIRQQMLGNAIAAATLVQTMNIADNTRNIADNTGQIARNTGNISAGLNKANDTLGHMAGRMFR